MFNFYLPAKNTVPLIFFFFNSWPNSLEFSGFFPAMGKKLLYPFFLASQWKNAAEPHVVPPVDESEFVLGGSRVTLPGCCRLIRSSASLTWPIKLSRCCPSVRPPGRPPTRTRTHTANLALCEQGTKLENKFIVFSYRSVFLHIDSF